MRLLKLGVALLFVAIAAALPARAADPENTMIITTKDGDITIALRPDIAPNSKEADGRASRIRESEHAVLHHVRRCAAARRPPRRQGQRSSESSVADPDRMTKVPDK
jgi:UTP:GlnB (protein PII) uridylyltransferase